MYLSPQKKNILKRRNDSPVLDHKRQKRRHMQPLASARVNTLLPKVHGLTRKDLGKMSNNERKQLEHMLDQVLNLNALVPFNQRHKLRQARIFMTIYNMPEFRNLPNSTLHLIANITARIE